MCGPPATAARPARNIDEAVQARRDQGILGRRLQSGADDLCAPKPSTGSLKDRGQLVSDALAQTRGRPLRERVIAVVEALKQGGISPDRAGHLSDLDNRACSSGAAGGDLGRVQHDVDQRRAPIASLSEVHGSARRRPAGLGHHGAVRPSVARALYRRQEPGNGEPVPGL